MLKLDHPHLARFEPSAPWNISVSVVEVSRERPRRDITPITPVKTQENSRPEFLPSEEMKTRQVGVGEASPGVEAAGDRRSWPPLRRKCRTLQDCVLGTLQFERGDRGLFFAFKLYRAVEERLNCVWRISNLSFSDRGDEKLPKGCGFESVTLGNVTMSHRTRERPAECCVSLPLNYDRSARAALEISAACKYCKEYIPWGLALEVAFVSDALLARILLRIPAVSSRPSVAYFLIADFSGMHARIHAHMDMPTYHTLKCELPTTFTTKENGYQRFF
ncbi:hypothetical protein EVAR_36727_1 [Eumeta japonica]|uniref:Uncharacterized protein n=1 Tax=Eumeta variegata TaxID=151549 RepID=A0A4C1X1U9_EUMVA|nr:hypothetical protein EVAR_36727_1 [Eumeta japonica]